MAKINWQVKAEEYLNENAKEMDAFMEVFDAQVAKVAEFHGYTTSPAKGVLKTAIDLVYRERAENAKVTAGEANISPEMRTLLNALLADKGMSIESLLDESAKPEKPETKKSTPASQRKARARARATK